MFLSDFDVFYNQLLKWPEAQQHGIYALEVQLEHLFSDVIYASVPLLVVSMNQSKYQNNSTYVISQTSLVARSVMLWKSLE